MEMTGSERISATPEEVYAALNDEEILMQALPGCKELSKESDTEFDAVITVKVGPIKPTFKMAGKLSDLNPPKGYTIAGEGKGGMAGFVKGSAEVQLEPDEDACILHYTVSAQIGGRLAQLGARLINSTAMKYASSFFSNLNEIMSGEDDEQAGEDTAEEDQESNNEQANSGS